MKIRKFLRIEMKDAKEIAKCICSDAQLKIGKSYNLINASSFSNILENHLYWKALNNSGTNLIDGRPLSLYLSLRENRKRVSSRGKDIFCETLREQKTLQITNVLVYFEGHDENLLTQYVCNLTLQDNVLLIPVSDLMSINDLSERIQEALPTGLPAIIWLMLGSPKQEIISAQISRSSNYPVVGIGGVVDFVTGKTAEAPKFVQIIYLEWFFRFIHEPKRLFRRYTFGNLIFLRAIILDCAHHFRFKSKHTAKSEELHFYVSKP